MYKWMRTDTAAIMFAAIQTRKLARICYVTATFKSLEIDPEKLDEAVRDLTPRFPGFWQKLRKGLFWSWLESTQSPPVVAKDVEVPARMQWISRTQGGPEFRILYGEHSITLESSHVLADGTGLMDFLKAIILRYLEKCGYDMSASTGIRRFDDSVSETEYENAYARYQNGQKAAQAKTDKAYQMPADFADNYLHHVLGFIDVDKIKAVSKPRNATITEYLVSALILAIIRNAGKPISNAIVISVPTNMRKFFPSDTTRNFSAGFPVIYKPCSRSDQTIDEICDCVRGQIKAQMTKENIQGFINSTYALTQNFALRIIPNFIKNPGLRAIQKVAHRQSMTTMFSNIGNLALPECIAQHIERIDMIGGDSRGYGMPVFCGVASTNGLLSLCFSYCVRDVSMSEKFFDILREDGVELTVQHRGGDIDTKDNYKRLPIGRLSLEKIKAFCNF